MSSTHIVIIHGLASKPPKETLAVRYRKHLQESVGREIPSSRIHVAYWADLMGYVPPDGPEEDEYVDGGQNFRTFSLIEQLTFHLKGEARSRVVQIVEQRLGMAMMGEDPAASGAAEIISALPGQLAGGPARHIYGRFLPDLHRYFFAGFRDAVRNRLREQIAEVPDGSDLCLIAHSMGSIIAADVILADHPSIKTLITIGSPLGIQVVQEQLGVDHDAKQGISNVID
jgi:hypothetical protein